MSDVTALVLVLHLLTSMKLTRLLSVLVRMIIPVSVFFASSADRAARAASLSVRLFRAGTGLAMLVPWFCHYVIDKYHR